MVTLITGMSGTGKSSVILELQSLGFNAVDLDQDTYSMWIDAEGDPEYPDNEVQQGKDWVWNEERILELLSSAPPEPLFLSGCASNMGKFYASFDHVILLTAPDVVIVERLSIRDGLAYGQSPEEVERVLRLKQTIEPLLRAGADLELNTSGDIRLVVKQILDHVE